MRRRLPASRCSGRPLPQVSVGLAALARAADGLAVSAGSRRRRWPVAKTAARPAPLTAEASPGKARLGVRGHSAHRRATPLVVEPGEGTGEAATLTGVRSDLNPPHPLCRKRSFGCRAAPGPGWPGRGSKVPTHDRRRGAGGGGAFLEHAQQDRGAPRRRSTVTVDEIERIVI